MKKLTLGAVLALVFVMIAGVFSVQAQDPTPTPLPALSPSFTDGRLNAYDPGAPVAIFETRQSVPIINSNGVPTTADIVCGVQLLYWNGSSAQQVLFVTTDQILSTIGQFAGNNNSNSNSNKSNSNSASGTNTNVSNSTNNGASNSSNGNTNAANSTTGQCSNNNNSSSNTTTGNSSASSSNGTTNNSSNTGTNSNSNTTGNSTANNTGNTSNNGTTNSSNTGTNSNSNTSGNSTTNSNNASNSVTSSNNSSTSDRVGTVMGDSILVAASNGYKMFYSKSGYLWIMTPANFEGKVYTFSWQKDF